MLKSSAGQLKACSFPWHHNASFPGFNAYFFRWEFADMLTEESHQLLLKNDRSGPQGTQIPLCLSPWARTNGSRAIRAAATAVTANIGWPECGAVGVRSLVVYESEKKKDKGKGKKKKQRAQKCHLKANVLDWVSAAREITGQQFALVQRKRPSARHKGDRVSFPSHRVQWQR